LGLLLGWDFCSSAWTEAKLFVEVEDMTKSQIAKRQLEQKIIVSKKDENLFVSQPSSKPHVGCCVLSTRKFVFRSFFRFRLASVNE
jgi:hypothetical protein